MTKASTHLLFWLVSLAFVGMPTNAWATRVSGGGDAWKMYLDATRENILFVLKRVAGDQLPVDVRPDSREQYFTHQDVLRACGGSGAQAEECAALIEETALEMYGIVTNPQVEFIILDRVRLENGEERDAKTDSDPTSDIEFSRLRMQAYNADAGRMAGLMYHEFGHKIRFRGEIVTDLGGTAAFEHGELLLGRAGDAVADLLRERGQIGGSFVVTDYFLCYVTESGVRLDPPRVARGKREFLDQTHTKYIAGFDSDRIRDEVIVDGISYIFQPRLRISEYTDCKEDEPIDEHGNARRMEPSIRVLQPMHELISIPPESDYNILCSPGRTIEISYFSRSYACQYDGSEVGH